MFLDYEKMRADNIRPYQNHKQRKPPFTREPKYVKNILLYSQSHLAVCGAQTMKPYLSSAFKESSDCGARSITSILPVCIQSDGVIRSL